MLLSSPYRYNEAILHYILYFILFPFFTFLSSQNNSPPPPFYVVHCANKIQFSTELHSKHQHNMTCPYIKEVLCGVTRQQTHHSLNERTSVQSSEKCSPYVKLLETPQATARPEFVILSYILSSRDVKDDDDEGISADTVLACIIRFITQKSGHDGCLGIPGDVPGQCRILSCRCRIHINIGKLFTPKT